MTDCVMRHALLTILASQTAMHAGNATIDVGDIGGTEIGDPSLSDSFLEFYHVLKTTYVRFLILCLFHACFFSIKRAVESLIFQVATLQRMTYPREKVAGILFFIAAMQFVLGLTIAEALYPGYSVSENYISDLGIGPSSIIFNSAAFLLGLLSLIGTYFLRHVSNFKTLNTLLLLMAIGAMGVGVFTKNYTTAHGAVATMTFFFAGLSAISSSKVLEKPLSLISIILGVITLGALGLFSSGMITSGSLTSDIAYNSDFYMSLGPGGMEHMIIYPAGMWLAGFSWHLITRREMPTEKEHRT